MAVARVCSVLVFAFVSFAAPAARPAGEPDAIDRLVAAQMAADEIPAVALESLRNGRSIKQRLTPDRRPAPPSVDPMMALRAQSRPRYLLASRSHSPPA